MKKNVINIMLVLALMLFSSGMLFANGTAESKATSQEVIEISLAHANAIDQPIGRYADEFAKKVNERSNGHIHITVYPASQLGNMVDLMDNLSNGLQDMCIIDVGNLDNYKPAYAMVSLPMIINNWDQAAKILDSDQAKQMNEELAEESNMRLLGWWWNGFRNMCSKVAIHTIADFKGVKFRSPGAEVYLTMFNLLGAKPTPIPWGETYSAMQSGIVDGMETVTEALATQSFYKLGKYILLTRHIFSCNAPAISEKLWRSLSEEDRTLLRKCMDEVTAEIRTEVIDSEAGYLEQLETSGNEVVRFDDQREELLALFKPYWNEYAKAHDCKDFLDFIISCQ